MSIIAIVLICLLAMFVVAELLRFLRVPRVVSQVATGMIFGIPLIKNYIFTAEGMSVISFLADIGVIVLLFFVGLQINFKQLGKTVLPSAGVSMFNTAFPLILGFLASKFLFQLDTTESIIIGVCMSVSATAIALDLMEEFKKLRTRLGTFIVTAGTFDDLVELFLITGILTFFETAVKQTSLWQLFIGLIAFTAIAIAFRLWIIPALLRLIESETERALIFTGALLITLVMAVLAELLGVGALIGALFSGVIIRQALLKDAGHKPWERSEISHNIHTIAFGFLVPFFFFHVGMQANIAAIWGNILFGIVITALAIIGTVFGSAFGYALVNKNWEEGYIVGWALNAKGDTELIIADLALSAGVITSAIYSSLIFMAVVSTLISPYILKKLIIKHKWR